MADSFRHKNLNYKSRKIIIKSVQMHMSVCSCLQIDMDKNDV